MFHNYKMTEDERERWVGEQEPAVPEFRNVVLNSPRELTDEETTDLLGSPEDGEWVRIERKIHSPFWRGVHNLVAHPLLTLYRPWGEKLHDYTAERMYADNGRPPVVSDKD